MSNTDEFSRSDASSVSGGNPVPDAQAANGRCKSIISIFDQDSPPSVHNFPGTPQEQWRMRALACGAACKGFDDMPEGGIELKWWYVHRVEMVAQQTGEVIEPFRVVLMTPEQHCYGFVSEFMVRELDGIREMFGEGPYDPPLKIRVVKAKSRKGFNFYSIEPV